MTGIRLLDIKKRNFPTPPPSGAPFSPRLPLSQFRRTCAPTIGNVHLVGLLIILPIRVIQEKNIYKYGSVKKKESVIFLMHFGTSLMVTDGRGNVVAK